MSRRAVSLEAIGAHNWQQCIELAVGPGQEEFLPANVYSLAECYVDPTNVPLGIYAGSEMVGFAMYTVHSEGDGKPWFAGEHRPEHWIARFMIDRRHQGNGYGHVGLEAMLELLRQRQDCHTVFLSFHPSNLAARGLYYGAGFETFGMTPWGEVGAALDMTSARRPSRLRARTPARK